MEHQFRIGETCLDRDGDRVVVVRIYPSLLVHMEGNEDWSWVIYEGTEGLRKLESSQDQVYHRDAGKPDPTLIPSAALMQVVSVFEHGLEKGYEPRSWRQVPDAQARYLKSLARHFQAVLKAVQDGEEGGLMVLDPDGGRPHLAAIAADALILLDLGLRGEGK